MKKYFLLIALICIHLQAVKNARYKALREKVCKEDVEGVRKVITKAHSAINKRDKRGATLLHFATYPLKNSCPGDRAAIIELLLKHGADPRICDYKDRTAYDLLKASEQVIADPDRNEMLGLLNLEGDPAFYSGGEEE